MKSQSGVDLSLVSADEMWEELKTRFDGVILTTVGKNIDNLNEAIQISYSGGKSLCIGLCEHTKDKILEALRSNVKEKE